MCRLYGFRATEATKVECTLARSQNALLLQSRGDLRGIAHVDGWGIGYYPDGVPVLERRAAAAHADLFFGETAERAFSRTVVAHVRHATVGVPELANTHPFTWGRWLFAHNGTVTGFAAVRPRLEAEIPPPFRRHRRGTTDSELAFYWLLSRISAHGLPIEGPEPPAADLAHVLSDALRTLAHWCEQADSINPPRLNFILTNGATLLASRWNNTLCWVERRGIHDCEICGIPHVHHAPGTAYRAVVVASEPLSHEAWLEIPEASILVVNGTLEARIQAV